MDVAASCVICAFMAGCFDVVAHFALVMYFGFKSEEVEPSGVCSFLVIIIDVPASFASSCSALSALVDGNTGDKKMGFQYMATDEVDM